MRTVTFKSVLEGTAWLGGFAYADMNPAMQAELVSHINMAYRYGWEMYDWPEAMKYVKATLQTHPDIADARFVPYVTSSHDIKTVYGVALDDPRVKRVPRKVHEYRLGNDGIYFPEAQVTEVWVEYREPSPCFTHEPWDAAKTYVEHDLVYLAATGRCYRALRSNLNKTPDANVDDWAEVPFMALLAEAVKNAAHAARVRADGREEAAALLAEVMDEYLANEVDVLELQSGHNKRFTRR